MEAVKWPADWFTIELDPWQLQQPWAWQRALTAERAITAAAGTSQK